MAEFTTADGTQIFFKDWGAGQPIVFSHGWPLSSDDWDAQLLFFLRHGYRVIAHDRRGHGRSAQVSDGNDMDHYADDLPALPSTSTCTTPSTSGTRPAAGRWLATSAVTARLGWRRSLARRPAEWRAFFAYHDALMDKETPALSKGDRELIVVATSAENRRWPPTGAGPSSMTGSVRFWRSPSSSRSSRGRSMPRSWVRCAHGLTDDDIWDVGSISAFFALKVRPHGSGRTFSTIDF